MKTKFLILFAAIFIVQIYMASALTIRSATSNPSEVQPGERFSLNLKIENNLNEDVEDIVVNLVLSSGQTVIPFAPYQSSNEVRIDDIAEDDKENADFDLMTFSDATSGTYTIPVQVSYTLSNGTRVSNENLGIVSVIINAKPKIGPSLEDSILIKGTTGKITIKIVNSGLGDSKFLSVSLNSVSGIQTTSSSSVYIGNIDSNDFDTVDFNVFVNANAPSTINLPVKITYTDSQNNPLTQDNTILIKTYTVKEAKSLGLISGGSNAFIIILIISIVIIFFVYRSVRKRRRSKRNGQ